MKKAIRVLGIVLLIIIAACGSGTKRGVTIWPLMINSGNILAKVMEPQVESYSNNVLMAHATISVKESDTAEPIFGTIWFSGIVKKGDTSYMELENLDLSDIRFSDMADTAGILNIKTSLAKQLQNSSLAFSGGKIRTQLERSGSDPSGNNMSTTPPKIIFTTIPTVLILIDGNPILEKIQNSKLERVVNTPFLLIKNNEDGKYYLNASHQWFTSTDIKGSWHKINLLPPVIKVIDQQVKEQAKQENQPVEEDSGVIPDILVSYEPCELIQTDGLAVLSAVEGTSLMAVTNTNDQIFRERNAQQYYVLLSGRWYTATTLQGPWSYVDPARLPADFAKIPAGGEKDVVLSSVSGTKESQDAVHEARIPKTAKVDRKSAKAEVQYDGTPEFENVETGSNVQYATNTSSSVLKIDGNYYVVDNGIWYVSSGPEGPWEVATERPDEVNTIPPSSPVYNVRYVYIYDVTPDFVYVGYTPGYTGCYVYGSTVVYGTGYYYRPWHAHIYYPRPITYGFGMHYNPYYGWGFHSRYNWYAPPPHYGGGFHQHQGGWWGPADYHPPYSPPFYSDNGRREGYYRPQGRNNYHPHPDASLIPGPRPINLYEGNQAVRPTRGFDTRGYRNPTSRPEANKSDQSGVRPGVNTRPGVQPGTRPEPGSSVRHENRLPAGTQPGTKSTKENNRVDTKPELRPDARPGANPSTRNDKNVQPGTRQESNPPLKEDRKIPNQNKTQEIKRETKPPQQNHQPATKVPDERQSNPAQNKQDHKATPPQRETQPIQQPKQEAQPQQRPPQQQTQPAQKPLQRETQPSQQQIKREVQPPVHEAQQSVPPKRETQPAQHPTQRESQPAQQPVKRETQPTHQPQKQQSKPANDPKKRSS